MVLDSYMLLVFQKFANSNSYMLYLSFSDISWLKFLYDHGNELNVTSVSAALVKRNEIRSLDQKSIKNEYAINFGALFSVNCSSPTRHKF